MKIGDLVQLNPIHFYDFDETIGIIVDISLANGSSIYKVAWMSDKNGDEIAWFHQEELEVVNESR